jgi:hypothetical protein
MNRRFAPERGKEGGVQRPETPPVQYSLPSNGNMNREYDAFKVLPVSLAALRFLQSITKSFGTWGRPKDTGSSRAPNADRLLYFLYVFSWHSSQYPPTSVRDTVTFILKSRAICCFNCS